MNTYLADAISFGGLLVVWSNDGRLNKAMKLGFLCLLLANVIAAVQA